MLYQAIQLFLVHNVSFIPRDIDNIVSDNRIINNDIIGFTETHMKISDSNCKIIRTLNIFNINLKGTLMQI